MRRGRAGDTHEVNQFAPGKDLIRLGEMTVQFLVEPGDSDGSVSVFRSDLPANSQVRVLHSHDGFEETIYELTGETTWTVNGGQTRLGPGDALLIPRRAVHGYAVTGVGVASILCVATPGLFGPGYFREMAELFEAAEGGAPDRDALTVVMERHGITPA